MPQLVFDLALLWERLVFLCNSVSCCGGLFNTVMNPS